MADAAAATIEDLHPDLLTRVLRHLDGAALAAAGCAASHLHALTAQPDLWAQLCLSSWPSLRLLPSFPTISHRSFYAESFPFPTPDHTDRLISYETNLPDRLISAVDLFHKGKHVFSRVLETDTSTPWFLGAPFRLDALDRKDPPPSLTAAAISTTDLTLSWILIDPARPRAANLSSRRPMSVDRHWYTGEIQARFATVLAGGEVAATAVVTCWEDARNVLEVSLTVEGMDAGMCLNGRESLVILQSALGGKKKGMGDGEVKRRYEEFVGKRREVNEWKVRREVRLDMCCVVFGISLFLTFLAFLGFTYLFR